MDEIPTFATFDRYRGRRYRHRSGGDDDVRIEVEGELSLDRFPDAIEFNDVADKPWVMLPRDALEGSVEQRVYGRWHGQPVAVVSQIAIGLRRGLVVVEYEGTKPDEAIAAGFSADQHNGWSAQVPPSEVEDVRVETREYPGEP